MSVVDDLAALPADLRRRPLAAVSLAAAIVSMVSLLPALIYGGNIGVAVAQSCVALAALWVTDQILEGEP